MDYNYTNQPEMGYRKKFDVKGIVFTIASLVLSLITALSTLMPLISMGNGMYSENINIIDTCKLLGVVAESPSYNTDFFRIMIFVMAVLVLLLPIMISLFGIIFTIFLIVSLVCGKYSSKVNGYAKTILITEMIFSVFMYGLAAGAMELYGLRLKNYSKITLSVGWYLPVILSLCVMFLGYVWDICENIKKAENKAKAAVMSLFSVIVVIIAAVMYVALGGSQYNISEKGYEMYVQFSVVESLALVKFDIMPILISLFIIVIASMSYICLSRNMKLMKKSKFGGVICLVTGICAVMFTIINYILFSIYMDEDKFSGTSFELGSTGYIYIIMGSILIVLGIAYLCIRTFWNNRANMVYVQYQNNAPDNNTVILQQQQNAQYYQNVQNGAYVQTENTQQ